MDRQILGVSLVNVILTAGIGWGALTFLWGLISSFVFRGPDILSGLVALVFGYFAVLPITIMAFWRPRPSSVCLLFSFLVLVSALLRVAPFRYVIGGALVMGVPTATLALGYSYVARARTRIDAKGRP